MSSEEAKKLEVLLEMKSKGYNLIDCDKPEIKSMSLGGGYTLECNVKIPSEEWKIFFNDGVEITEYPANSEKVIYTHRKDSDKLIDEYIAGLKRIGIVENRGDARAISKPTKRENPTPAINKNPNIKGKKSVDAQKPSGMLLPIVYPPEMKGKFMRFIQWTADNDVIPKNSEIVILDDDEYSFRVSIPLAHISFEIKKDKAEVVEA